jgi:hypothetical protein
MLERRVMHLAGLALAAQLGAGCVVGAGNVTTRGEFSRTMSVSGPVYLDVRTGSGDIRIRTGPDNAVHVVGRIRAHTGLFSAQHPADRVRAIEANPPVEQRGDAIQIGHTGDPELRRNVSISYEITVPVDTRVRSHTGSGDHTIGPVRGPVDAAGGSGDIRIDRVEGQVNASTGSGDIEVAGAEGLRARAGSGSIDVSGVAGRLELRTGSGDITIDSRPEGDWAVDTGSGDLRIRVPEGSAFLLDATTSSGDIDTVHPVEVQGRQSRRRLAGAVRGGGPRLELTTSSGDIRID